MHEHTPRHMSDFYGLHLSRMTTEKNIRVLYNKDHKSRKWNLLYIYGTKKYNNHDTIILKVLLCFYKPI